MTPETLTRDGHLTTLSLERHLAGEIDATPHLDTCSDCAARWVALQAEAAVPMPRPKTTAEAPASRWPMIGGALAIAAALAIFVLRPAPTNDIDDGIRTKGSFAFEVHAHDGTRSRLLLDGDTVAAGERLGFRVQSQHPRDLLILGRDGSGAYWLAWPQGVDHSQVFTAQEARSLGEAVVLDATPGDETLFALLCDAAIDQAKAAPALTRGVAPDGCRMRQITVKKAGKTP